MHPGYAQNTSAVRALVQLGTDLTQVDNNGNTALIRMCLGTNWSNTYMVQELCQSFYAEYCSANKDSRSSSNSNSNITSKSQDDSKTKTEIEEENDVKSKSGQNCGVDFANAVHPESGNIALHILASKTSDEAMARNVSLIVETLLDAKAR